MASKVDPRLDAQGHSATPPGFETAHRFLFIGTSILFFMICVTCAFVFPFLLWRYGWQ
jgi:hypothetical protein